MKNAQRSLADVVAGVVDVVAGVVDVAAGVVAGAALAGALLLSIAPTPAVAQDYVTRPEVSDFVNEMSREHGFHAAELLRVLGAAEKKQAILDAISRPAEKTLSWGEYGKIFLQDSRIRGGMDFWEKHRRTLQRAAETFGVPPEIIIAIIGVETRYGDIMGNYRTLDALVTLAFDYPPRARFFRSELGEYFLLTREYGFDPLSLKGSYAGAMGYGQFISSSYRNYAVDFDGDGTADLLGNPIDAIGSVGNYLARHGWQSGEPVLVQADTAENFVREVVNRASKPQTRIADWREQGFSPRSARTGEEQLAVVLGFSTGDKTEHWFGLHNFYVLTRYNRSRLYVMAVHQLAQELRARTLRLRRTGR